METDSLHKFSLYNEIAAPYLNTLDEADKIYYTLRSIAKADQTAEMVEDAIINYSANSRRPILGVLSKNQLTKELCRVAFQNDKRNFPLIPKKFIDKEMSEQAVVYDGSYLSYVPVELRTKELCIKALNNSSKDHYKFAIDFIPAKILNIIGRERAYRPAVEQNPTSIQSIPLKYVTEELAELAVTGTQQDISGHTPIKYIPTRFLTESLIAKAVESYPQSVQDIPEKYITVKLCKSHPSCIEYLPLDYMSSKKRNLLRRELNLPEKALTSYIYPVPINNEPEITNIIPINAIPGKQCVKETNKSLNYRTTQPDITNTIHAAKKEEVNIYYVTDLHLEHHIDLNGIASDKAYELIDEFVKKILATAHTPGIILTGGDISSYTYLNIMFYNSLRNNWDGPIISVLGNHDLWSLDGPNLLGLQTDEALRILRSNTHDVTFLENGLYIELSKNVYGYRHELNITEANILDADEKELTEYCYKANVIILGGLGFSGCNEEFNALNGIYSQSTTREDDIENSKRFEAVYNKLLRCANDVPVIVLTHTPMRDWSKQPYNGNWIYISGHTHKNVMSIKKNGAIVLENNQFGYCGKFCRFKKLVLNHAVYDPLCDLENGIHEISKLQYLDFMYIRKIPIPEMKRTGKFWAIKKEEIYLFILETNGKSYILNGAQAQRAEKNKEYYYKNISKYYNNVSRTFSSFYQYEETVSSLIQAIGGEGTIHGCIVDYDYYNHVYVNPFDETLTPYYAISMTYKMALSNFEALVESGKSTNALLFGNAEITIDTDKNALQLLNNKLSPTNLHGKVITDTSMYRVSNIFRTLQYTIESHVIRKWNDAILNLPENCSLSELPNYIEDENQE